ncbi:MAG: type II secretion system protein [Phycisphaerales bacterium]|jgi:prepilin-type N-terminal cleavage/methylation domain-containing protein
MTSSAPLVRRPSVARGFTLVELLAVAAIVGLLVSLLLPAIARARDGARTTQSLANLRNLGAANEAYAADWSDRQFTAHPDDAGLAGGSCSQYLSQIACPPQQIIGNDTFGIWGYFLGSSGHCSGFNWPEACFNWAVYVPIHFGSHLNPGGGSGFGSFRMPGVERFAAYLNGRFYDPALYAPKDELALEVAERYFQSPAAFTFDGVHYADSSYCFSPAAMWNPAVMRRDGHALDGNGFTPPGSMPSGFRSPPVSRCRYPSLKTRMIEHSWLQHRPHSAVNPSFAGGRTPWFFNHGLHSAPGTLFFDGHVELVGCARAMQGDQRAGGLWSRNTPFGAFGYYGGQSYDYLVRTSFHILTTDGIEGRDVLGAE